MAIPCHPTPRKPETKKTVEIIKTGGLIFPPVYVIIRYNVAVATIFSAIG